jgi:hypothetical protein
MAACFAGEAVHLKNDNIAATNLRERQDAGLFSSGLPLWQHGMSYGGRR